jgi:CubicO group peptidase (beta-lactamase class C family)
MLKQIPPLLVAYCLCLGIASAQAEDVDTYLRHEMETRKIPGVAFAVVDRGKVVTERAYGSANLDTGTPLGTHGVFELASVTKPFTATAVMMLVEEGKIGLDDPILKYIQNGPIAWKDITVHQLLSHTSGLRGVGWVECDDHPGLAEIRNQGGSPGSHRMV